MTAETLGKLSQKTIWASLEKRRLWKNFSQYYSVTHSGWYSKIHHIFRYCKWDFVRDFCPSCSSSTHWAAIRFLLAFSILLSPISIKWKKINTGPRLGLKYYIWGAKIITTAPAEEEEEALVDALNLIVPSFCLPTFLPWYPRKTLSDFPSEMSHCKCMRA